MASEDFAFMLERIPGCYLFIGNGVDSEGGCSVHNPRDDFNRNLPIGAAYWAALATHARPIRSCRQTAPSTPSAMRVKRRRRESMSPRKPLAICARETGTSSERPT